MKFLKLNTLITNRVLLILGLVLIGGIIYWGQSIIVPLGFSFLISMVLLPVYRFFKKIKFPETLAILAAIVSAILLVAAIVGVISYELSTLFGDIDTLQKNINTHLITIAKWVQSKTGFTINQQFTFLNQQIADLKSSKALVSNTTSMLSSLLVWFGLVPVYVFLILYYKNMLLRFVFLCSKTDHHDTIEESIYQTEDTLKSYLIGLLWEMLIVGVLISVTLMLFGVKYAILIAAIFAVLNTIPYVGSLIANALAVLITLTTSTELSNTIIVVIVLTVVQLIDNNIIMTYVVASKVKLNAFVTIIAVIMGERLAGVGGMFLAIPTVAVLKLVFDKIDNLKHWGMLFGDTNFKLNPLSFHVLRLRRRFGVKEEVVAALQEEKTTA